MLGAQPPSLESECIQGETVDSRGHLKPWHLVSSFHFAFQSIGLVLALVREGSDEVRDGDSRR